MAGNPHLPPIPGWDSDSQFEVDFGERPSHEHSFMLDGLKIEHWREMEPEMDDFGAQSEGLSAPELAKNQSDENSFVGDVRKVLEEFQELKQGHKNCKNHQNSPSEVQYQRGEPSNEGKTRVQRPIKRRFIAKNGTKRGKKSHRLKNLKNISSEVANFISASSRTTFTDIFDKFMVQNPTDCKNLRRRIYDVINVLSAVNLLEKKGAKGLVFNAQNSKTSSIKQNPQLNLKALQQIETLQNLSEVYKNRQQDLQHKRKLLKSLRAKKNYLEKLGQRNEQRQQRSGQSMNETIRFPFACFVPEGETEIKAGKKSVKIVQNSAEFNSMRTESDVLCHINFRKSAAMPNKFTAENPQDFISSLSWLRK